MHVCLYSHLHSHSHTHKKQQHLSLYCLAAPACDGLCKQGLLYALGSQRIGTVLLWSSTQLWGQQSNFTLFLKYNTWVTRHVEVWLRKSCPMAKVPLMVGRRTQQILATMVQQSLAPASHVQGDSAAGTHSTLHDPASLTRCWTAAINKTMTRSLCHLSDENSFLPRCDIVSLAGQIPLLQRITIATSLTESSNLWNSCPRWRRHYNPS